MPVDYETYYNHIGTFLEKTTEKVLGTCETNIDCSGWTAVGRLVITDKPNLTKAERVIFNEPATIVLWSDKTKTVVKCDPNDQYDRMKGVALCYMKKFLGNTSRELNKALRSSGAYEETNKESEEE